jgi:hypothetical protein
VQLKMRRRLSLHCGDVETDSMFSWMMGRWDTYIQTGLKKLNIVGVLYNLAISLVLDFVVAVREKALVAKWEAMRVILNWRVSVNFWFLMRERIFQRMGKNFRSCWICNRACFAAVRAL